MAWPVPMSDRLIRTAADMVELFVARAKTLGLAHREIDERAGLGDGYFSKVACGDRKPGALTIERICGALALGFVPFVLGTAQEGVCLDGERGEYPENERRHDEQGSLNSGSRVRRASREIGG